MNATPKTRPALLARAGAALAVALLAGAGAPVARADDAREERFEKTYELTGVRKVRLQNVNGPVSIESGGEHLKVVAVKTVKRGSDFDVLKDTEISPGRGGSSSGRCSAGRARPRFPTRSRCRRASRWRPRP